MPIVFKKGLTESELARVESELNILLPAGYRDFLERMNGLFIVAPDYVEIPLSSVEDGFISFDRIFGWHPQEECNDVVAFNKEFIDELAFLGDVIAIGEDGGGNPYVIVSQSKRDGVYYWDRTHLHDEDSLKTADILEKDDSGSLYFVSSSLGEFYKLITIQLGGHPVLVEDK